MTTIYPFCFSLLWLQSLTSLLNPFLFPSGEHGGDDEDNATSILLLVSLVTSKLPLPVTTLFVVLCSDNGEGILLAVLLVGEISDDSFGCGGSSQHRDCSLRSPCCMVSETGKSSKEDDDEDSSCSRRLLDGSPSLKLYATHQVLMKCFYQTTLLNTWTTRLMTMQSLDLYFV